MELSLYKVGVNEPIYKTSKLDFTETVRESRSLTFDILSDVMLDFPILLNGVYQFYATFNGEIYLLYNQPTLSKTTDKLKYKYTTTLENCYRDIENIYMKDFLMGNEYYNATTDFAFNGDLQQLVYRINANLQHQLSGWSIVIQEGYTLPEKTFVISFSKQTIASVLKETFYDDNKVDYDVTGKVITIGVNRTVIDNIFNYANGLESINESASSEKPVTRISGTGGTRNIPYNYYRNLFPDWKNNSEKLMPAVLRNTWVSEGIIKTYYDVENPQYAFNEDIEEDNEDIYPSIANIRNQNGLPIDELTSVPDSYDDSVTDDYQLKEPVFEVTINNPDFDLFNSLSTQGELTMWMQTGANAGTKYIVNSIQGIGVNGKIKNTLYIENTSLGKGVITVPPIDYQYTQDPNVDYPYIDGEKFIVPNGFSKDWGGLGDGETPYITSKKVVKLGIFLTPDSTSVERISPTYFSAMNVDCELNSELVAGVMPSYDMKLQLYAYSSEGTRVNIGNGIIITPSGRTVRILYNDYFQNNTDFVPNTIYDIYAEIILDGVPSRSTDPFDINFSIYLSFGKNLPYISAKPFDDSELLAATESLTLRVFKDTSTMGKNIIRPTNLFPLSVGDKFVFENIDFSREEVSRAYIVAAENKLEDYLLEKLDEKKYQRKVYQVSLSKQWINSNQDKIIDVRAGNKMLIRDSHTAIDITTLVVKYGNISPSYEITSGESEKYSKRAEKAFNKANLQQKLYYEDTSKKINLLNNDVSGYNSGLYTKSLSNVSSPSLPTSSDKIETHTHLISDITNLQASLDGKLGISATAANSAKLGGNLPSYYAVATHNHDSVYAASTHDHSGGLIRPSTLVVPTTEPTGQGVGEVALYLGTGSYAENPSGGGSAAWSDITGKPTSLAGYGIADAYTKNEVTSLLGSLAVKAHTHTKSDITDFAHSHSWTDITSKPTAFTPTSHSHAIADITNLSDALSAKADASHDHSGQLIRPATFVIPASTPVGQSAGDMCLFVGTGSYAETPTGGSSAAWSDITGKPTTIAGYGITDAYTKSEIVSFLNGKAALVHTHTISQITDFPTSLKNPYALTWSGYSSGSYDGSSAVNIAIPTTLPASDVYAWAKSASAPCYINTEGDNRSITTIPNDYSNRFIFRGLKYNTVIGTISPTTYSYLLGLRGWGEDSGGNAWELAFNNDGIEVRRGSSTSWRSFERLLTSGNYTSYITQSYINGLGISASYATSAAEALKLNSARSLWGQSFDGSANVSGNLYLSKSKLVWLNDAENYSIQINDDGQAYYKAYYGHHFYADGVERLKIASDGNVGIGTTSPAYKLHVAGKGYFSDTLTLSSTIYHPQDIITDLYRTYNNYNSGLMYQTYGNEALVWANQNRVTSFIFLTGTDPTTMSGYSWTTSTPALQIKQNSVYVNALIANDSTPAYNFYVNGTAYVSGAVTLGSSLTLNGALNATGNISASGNISCNGLEIPTSPPANPASGKWYLYLS